MPPASNSPRSPLVAPVGARKRAASSGVPGPGPVAPPALHKRGLRRDSDLALHVPLRYEDDTRITP
ncbi:MAG: hypothetical protein ACK5OA_04265, partial [Acidovorax sp.]